MIGTSRPTLHVATPPYLLAVFAFIVVASVMVVIWRAPKMERRFVPLSVISLLVFAFVLIVMALVGIYRSTTVASREAGSMPGHRHVGSVRTNPAVASSTAPSGGAGTEAAILADPVTP